MLGHSADTVVKGWCPHGGCTHGVPVPHVAKERGVRPKELLLQFHKEMLGGGTGVLVSGWGL